MYLLHVPKSTVCKGFFIHQVNSMIEMFLGLIYKIEITNVRKFNCINRMSCT